ncbi:lipoprotein [Spiroplasma endosymbiont of Cantharis rufa]|uniref:lipoprotein n=1 Tax=Spiroplasma endosymbiont of Cantharis rufa TaxID=3066279 RepID=UPI0030CB6551
MKKLLSLLGTISLFITSSSSVVSCIDTKPTIKHTLKDEFKTFDLGIISGTSEIPDIKLIYEEIKKSQREIDENWKWAIESEYIIFTKEPTIESCTIRVMEGYDYPTLTGEATFKYNYKKIEQKEISEISNFQSEKNKWRLVIH